MIIQYLEHEKPIIELESRIDELRRIDGESEKGTAEIARLEKKLGKLKKSIYEKLTPWQRTMIARHPNRPYFLDFVELLTEDFIEVHGDRVYRDDPSMVAGLATFQGRGVVIIGHQKGRNVKENVHRNFGMPHPEGYRKALRVMKLAEKFNKPVITLIDTPGAYPGLGAEERGQAEAIARNLYEMARLRTPIIVVVTGEGGSGGALAVGLGDRVMMMENAIYSVISPEACTAILWRDDKSKIPEAAAALRIDAKNALNLKVIDSIIQEPEGGAHRDHEEAAELLRQSLISSMDELIPLSTEELLSRRYDKFRAMGHVVE